MSAVQFDPDTHVYTLDGVRLLSVSEILRAGGLTTDYRGINPAILQHAADRGTYAEQCCRLWDEGVLDEDAVAEAAKGYVEAWKTFRKQLVFRPLAHQVLAHHPEYRYAGTLDVIGVNVANLTYVVDIKCTSKIDPSYRIQLAGYTLPGIEWADGPYNVHPRRAVVQVKPDGSYVFEEYMDGQDYEVFLAALQIAKWKRAA